MDEANKLPEPENTNWFLPTWWEEVPNLSNLLISREPLPETTCEACKAIPKEEHDEYGVCRDKFHVSSASPDTCGRCRVLVTFAMKLPGPLYPDEEIELVTTSNWRRIDKLELASRRPSTTVYYQWIISSLTTTTCPWLSFDAHHHTSSDCRLLESNPYDTTATWLNTSLTDHRDCNRSTETILPRRLLRIGTNYEHIKPTTGRYNCLSHCWGGKQPLKTTTINIAEHLQQIRWDAVPRTAEDWAKESGKMCDIYENAHLTIAAASSPNSTSGFSLSSTGYVRLSGKTSSDQPFHIVAHQTTHNGLSTTSPGMPLLSRAWVFQERILSRRVIYFCADVLVWECKSSHRCQCHSCHVSSNEADPQHGVYGREYSNGLIDTLAPNDLVRHWQSLVQDYTLLQLSFISDKLPALCGLANRIGKHKDQTSRYLAGLWSDSLLIDLLWRCNFVWHELATLRAHREWKAPSCTQVGESRRVQSLCTIVDAQVMTSTSDPTGRVSSGRLVLRGKLINATLGRLTSSREEYRYCMSLTGTSMAESSTPASININPIRRDERPFSCEGYHKEIVPSNITSLRFQKDLRFYLDPLPELFSPEMGNLGHSGTSLWEENIKCLRLARFEDWLLPPLDRFSALDTEVALILQRIEVEKGSSKFRGRTYRRIGIMVQCRFLFDLKSKEDCAYIRTGMRESLPGSLENLGGEEETILIMWVVLYLISSCPAGKQKNQFL
ncbi:hypothetical protein B0T20DRAFT_458086 [Sordaria brevicollis]|uniref:Heterokaryon incompatibility domain-containing protein n=1 Tax=Sordaria brevicollis TaxID=83679 RepID=A0AAE0UG24_SORBR|nr:hypothetical protein B0T20DRAFT_458086 [Sordaria brevicollis]